MIKQIFAFTIACLISFLPVSSIQLPTKQFIDNTLSQASTAVRHLTDVADIALLTDNLYHGKTTHNLSQVREYRHKAAIIQKSIQQISHLNSLLNNPQASTTYVTLQLIKKIEELIILIRDAISTHA